MKKKEEKPSSKLKIIEKKEDDDDTSLSFDMESSSGDSEYIWYGASKLSLWNLLNIQINSSNILSVISG